MKNIFQIVQIHNINDLRINDTYHSKTFNYVANNEIVEESLRQYYFFLNRTGFDTNTKSEAYQYSYR